MASVSISNSETFFLKSINILKNAKYKHLAVAAGVGIFAWIYLTTCKGFKLELAWENFWRDGRFRFSVNSERCTYRNLHDTFINICLHSEKQT